MSIGDNIKTLRLKEKLSQADLGKIAGVTDKAVSTWESGLKIPRMGAVEKMASYFGVPKSAILDDNFSASIPTGFEPLPQMTQVPLVGRIACGQPITAEQNIESVIGVPSAWHADFALTCRGDSMQPRYLDGDIVCIHRQPEVENGQIAAVRIGEEATLKRFYRQGDTVTLQAENPAYPPLVYQKEELNSIAIEGRVVGICRGEK